ncbi:MAG: NAD-dependent epimerase/dehydratase family protein [Natronomonas sp.]
MQDRRILVTGGAGFIGSNLANTLAEKNDVVAVDNEYLGTAGNLDSSVRFKNQSVTDTELPTDVDIVFHLAALSSYRMQESTPARGARTSAEGFTNVVEQARTDGCETVVYASSSSVYQDQASTQTSEDAPVAADTAYEASKLSQERYAEYFSTHYGMSLAGMRCFSVYQGYGGNEKHKDEYANVVAQFADDIAHGRQPTVYGDGTQTRDFTHVEDIVRGMILAAEHGLDGIYNLGTGEAYAFNTIVELLNETLERSVEPQYVENPIPESVYVTDTCADPSKMHEATGWDAQISFEEGLRRVCDPYLD